MIVDVVESTVREAELLLLRAGDHDSLISLCRNWRNAIFTKNDVILQQFPGLRYCVLCSSVFASKVDDLFGASCHLRRKLATQS